MSHFLSNWQASHIVFLPLSSWIQAALILLVLLSLVRAFLWWFSRKLSMRSTLAILLSNFLLLSCIIFILQRPYMEKKQLLSTKNISVTFDVSQSVQQVLGPEKLLRLYQDLYTKIRTIAEQQKLKVHFFSLANDLHVLGNAPLTANGLNAEAKNNTETNFEKLLAGLTTFQENQKTRFDANILFTDAYFHKNTEAIIDQYESQNKVTPLKIVFVHQQTLHDLAINSFNYYPIGFEGKDFTLSFKIHNGYSPHLTLPVQIWDDKQLVYSKQFALNTLGAHLLNLSFKPKGSGIHYYKLQIPHFAHELTFLNNQRVAEVLIRPNNLRVLQIAGQPSWDVRFMRKLLKKHPKFDLISFYILREMEDDNSVKPEEMSLIRFPSEQLFGTELTKFNFLIVHDFQFTKFLVNPELINNIGNYVLNGGSILLIGGHQSFLSHDYQPYEISKILPFVPIESPPQVTQNIGMMQLMQRFGNLPGFTMPEASAQTKNNAWLESPLKVNVTPLGKVHPITQFPVAFNEFNQYSQLRNINKVRALAEGANVLLEATDQAGNVHPLLICASRGKGRVCSLMTDTSWLLAFDARANGLSMNIYQSLWMNSFSWLTSDAAYEPMSLDLVTAESIQANTRVHIEMAAPKEVSKDWLTQGLNAEVLIKAENMPDQKFNIKLKYENTRKAFSADWSLSTPRYLLQSLKVLNVSFGDMKMNLSNQIRQFSNEQDQSEFTYLQPAAETSKLMQNKIATFALPQTHKEVQELLLADFQIQGEVKVYQDPIWNQPWVFMLLCGLIVLHWYHHKRYGIL